MKKKRGVVKQQKIAVSEASQAVNWEGGKGSQAWRHLLLMMSHCWQICAAVDQMNYSIIDLSIWEKDAAHQCCVFKHGYFWASNTNFFAHDYSHIPWHEEEKKMPEVCFKGKDVFWILSSYILYCDKLQSHLHSDWVISGHSKGTALIKNIFKSRFYSRRD